MQEWIPLWQSVNYVGLCGVTLVISVLAALYHLHYRVEFAAVITSIYFGISTVVYFLLSIATGLRSMVDVDVIRPYIQAGRSLQLVTLIWLLIVLSNRVLRERE